MTAKPKERNLLLGKTQGLIISLGRMIDAHATVTPDADFGKDYNHLRTLILEAFPHLERFLPPKADIWTDGNLQGCNTSYFQIYSYAEQIRQIVETDAAAKPDDA